nr:proline-rich protein 2-like [Globicephala melas]
METQFWKRVTNKKIIGFAKFLPVWFHAWVPSTPAVDEPALYSSNRPTKTRKREKAAPLQPPRAPPAAAPKPREAPRAGPPPPKPTTTKSRRRGPGPAPRPFHLLGPRGRQPPFSTQAPSNPQPPAPTSGPSALPTSRPPTPALRPFRPPGPRPASNPGPSLPRTLGRPPEATALPVARRSVGPPQRAQVRRWDSAGSAAAGAAAKTTRPPPPPPPGGGAEPGRWLGEPERRGLRAGGDRACADGGGREGRREDAEINKARGRPIRLRPSTRPAPSPNHARSLRSPKTWRQREIPREQPPRSRRRRHRPPPPRLPAWGGCFRSLGRRVSWCCSAVPGGVWALVCPPRQAASTPSGGAGRGGEAEGCLAGGVCPRLPALQTTQYRVSCKTGPLQLLNG